MPANAQWIFVNRGANAPDDLVARKYVEDVVERRKGIMLELFDPMANVRRRSLDRVMEPGLRVVGRLTERECERQQGEREDPI